jgi:lipopolysaccharide/colanic/teichoic acid biosynthesis glycosyltransferase
MRFSRTPSSITYLADRVRGFDLAIVGASPVFAFLLRDTALVANAGLADVAIYCAAGFIVGIASLLYFRLGLIAARFLTYEDVKQCVLAAFASSTVTAAVAFSISGLDGVPRSIPGLHFLVLGALLVGARSLAVERARDVAQDDYGVRRTENLLIVGANELAVLYIRLVETASGRRRRVVALLDDDAALLGRSIRGRVVAGSTASAEATIAEFAVHGIDVDRIVVTYTDHARANRACDQLRALCEQRGLALECLSDSLNLSPDIASGGAGVEERMWAQRSPAHVSAVRLDSGYWRFRRAMDVLLSGAAILALAPLFVVVTIAVLIDVGFPSLFWQERVGYRGRRISVHKFRTLRDPLDGRGRVMSDSERLSKIGRFLRSTRLDELPQLYDILRGDMSIIGPRPLLPIDLPEGDSFRLQAPPGLTGWAQVHGGKLVTPQEKSALDRWYILNVSFALDLKILWLTCLTPFRGDRRDEDVLRQALAEGRDTLEATQALHVPTLVVANARPAVEGPLLHQTTEPDAEPQVA